MEGEKEVEELQESQHPKPEVEYPTDSKAYSLLAKIGQGAFASVYKASFNDGNIIAVKVLNLDKVDSNLNEIRMEVQLMRLSLHPNILPCFTAFLSSSASSNLLWVVSPFMNKGSAVQALQYVRRRKDININMEKHIWYILRETLQGLQYIHENGQIHRDVKGSNILLDESSSVKIADFGVSGWLIPQNEKAKTFVGTPCWMAPEVMEQVHGYDYKADLWSLGITALELAKGYAPYAKYPPMKVLILTIQEDPPSLLTYEYDEDGEAEVGAEENWTSEFHKLISLLLQKDPTKRPNCGELLKSVYFTKMRLEAAKELRDEICSIVPDAGSDQNNNSYDCTAEQLEQSHQSRVSIMVSAVGSEERPPGTTWVFGDGSQVVWEDENNKAKGDVEDVMSELDQFCSTTGGENYQKSNNRETKKDGVDGSKDKDDTSKDDDGLDDFLDEFEKTTAGENFQRPLQEK
mmetsp:Transcript_3634/g.5537  ORF Transcript_3634/g.5537 Transcript_3634/m.5537 type:complete len:462 (-) Transcript_3634:113-1498(-)